jgi:hypothetical protein
MKCIPYLIAVFFVVVACEKEVTDIKLPQEAKKLVVFSYISPSADVIRVDVSMSVPSIGEVSTTATRYVIDAEVVISHKGQSKVIPFSNNIDPYDPYTPKAAAAYVLDASEFPIGPGETYTLSVKTPSGLEVSAQCTVPALAAELSEVTFQNGSQTGTNVLEFQKASWVNITEGVDNYYRYYMISKYSNSSYENVFYDKIVSGKTKSIAIAALSDSKTTVYKSDLKGIQAVLLTTDIHYYKSAKTIQEFRDKDGNPFAEPVLIYSNIQDGLGVFASYLVTKTDVSF